MIDFVFIVLGLLGLIVGTSFVISGAVSIARHFGWSELFVGLTILSIGSDLPELAVAVDSGIRNLRGLDASGIVVGSSIGSGFGQIGLVMGIAGLAGTLTLGRQLVYAHGAVLLASLLLLAVLAWDGSITRFDGTLLVLGFAIYFAALLMVEKGQSSTSRYSRTSLIKAWLSLLGGMAIVIVCSDLTVHGATALAESFGVGQSLIAMTIIGPGTSLPELFISLGALSRRKLGMSVGNVVGSTIFDALVPIGVAAMIATVSVEYSLVRIDLSALFVLSCLVLIFLLGRGGLGRLQALLLLLYYGGYMVLISLLRT